MSYADLRKKFGLEEEDEEGKREEKSKRYEELRRSSGLSYDQVDSNYINTFVNDADSFLKSAKGDYEKVGWNNARSTYDTRYKTLQNLNSRAASISNWLNTNKDKLDKEVYDNLSSYIKTFNTDSAESMTYFKRAQDAMSQYKTEADYNKAVKVAEEEAAKLSYDTTAGTAELQQMQDLYDKSAMVETWYIGYRMNPYSTPGENVESKLAIYNELTEKYGSRAKLKEAIEEKSKYIDEAIELQEWKRQADYYASFMKADDFDQKSKYVSTYRGGEDFNALSGTYTDTGFDDIQYDYINRNETARGRQTVNDIAYGTAFLGLDDSYLQYMTDEEIRIYNYLYDPKNKMATDEYLAFLLSDLNYRKRKADEQWWAEYAKESPVASSVFSVVMSPTKALTALGQVADYMDDGKIDQNAGYNKFSYSSTAIRNQVAADIAASGKWGSVGSWTYQLGMSMGDFLMNTAVSGGSSAMSLALMGSGAMADTVISAKDRGLSDDQAFTLGIVAAGAEIITEKFSLDALFKGDMSKGAMRYILNNAFVEGTEEVSSSLINLAADVLVSKDKSEWSMAIQEYLAEHPNATEQEAFQKVLEDNLLSLGLDFLGGALMGGTMGSGGAAINSFSQNAQYVDTGKSIMDVDGGVAELLHLASEMSGASAENIQKSLAKQSGKVNQNMDAGKTTDKAARQVGKLYGTVQSAAKSQNQADIVKSLTRGENGISQKDATAIAEAMVAQSYGQDLTRKQHRVLQAYNGNERVQNAKQTIVENENSTMGQRNQKVGKLEADIALGMINKMLDAQETEAITKESIGTEFTPEGSYEVSEDNKAIDKKTGETIDIKGVYAFSEGKMILDIGEGKTVNAKDVYFANDNDALIYEAVADMGDRVNAETANKLIAQYKGGDAMVFARGITQAYSYGYWGIDKSELLGDGSFAADLTEKQRNLAYELGKQYRPVKDQEKKALARLKARPGEKGVFYRDKDGNAIDIRTYLKNSNKTLTGVRKAGIEAMEKISAAMGVRFNIYETWTEGGKTYFLDQHGIKREGNPNGFYDTETGEIYIDINAGSDFSGTMLFTVAHELTHFLKQWSPEHFTKISDIVFRHAGFKGGVEALVAKQQKKAEAAGRTLSFEQGLEEVVADGMETILTDGKVVEFMVEVKQKDSTAWEKIKAWFKDLAEVLKGIVSAYSGLIANSTEGRKVSEFSEKLLNQIEQIFAEGAIAAGKNYQAAETQKNTTEEGGVKYSQKEPLRTAAQAEITRRYKAAVDQVLKMQNTKPDHLVIGYTPDVYTSLGMPSLPFVIGTGHVYSAAKTEAEAKLEGNYRKGTNYHGLGSDVVKNIYKALKDPIMIIASKDVNKNATPMRSTHSVVAIVDVGNSQKSLLLPVEITAERSVNGTRMNVNALSSVYERDVTPLIREAIAMENTGDVGVYYAKKEALTLPGAGVQFPIQLQQSIASSGIIHRFSEKVNMNISDPTQSQQFKRWFGDWQNHPDKASKIVNADGTPKVMYHGSPAQFTIFDKKKAKSSGAYGSGFYFTDSQSHAATYGQQYSVYLNIRNPLQYGNGTASRAQVRQFLEAVAENDDYSIENYGTYDVDSIVQNIMGKESKVDAFKAIQDISATAIGDMVEAVDLFNKVNGTKYDGIITATETVAFYPEQIKSATDNIGTFDGGNPDIRFSDREDRNNAPTFYSHMAKVVDAVKQDKLGAASVVNMLRGKGVKAEEIKWSGIEQWLDGKKSITKAELQEFIAGSMLQIEETVLDGKKKAQTEVRKHNRKEYGIYMDGKLVETVTKTDGLWRSTVNPSGVYESREDAITAAEHKLFPKPKWGSYTVEGGTNYREVLFKLPGATYSNTAMQNHWGKNAQGVLAHARIQDFNTFIGKMLFIEEIQSDWHNEGHNKGYVPKGQTESVVSEEAVPDAPFQNTYHEFVLKRLIREAAENDYDSIGWTTADIQSQRWSDEFAEGYRIEYDQDIPKFMKKYGKQWESTVGKTILDNGTEVWSMAITDSMKDSVLTEGQPLYSDRDYSYEALTGKPDMVVTTVGGNVPKNRANVAHIAKKNAARVGKFNPKDGSVSVYVDDIDTDVILSTKGLRHGLRRTQDPLIEPNYIVTVKAGEILKNAIRINEITPSDNNADGSYVLIGAAKDADGMYVVRFVVNHFDNNVVSMDVLYAVNAKKELAAHNAPRLAAKPLSVTSSVISIAELLDHVNKYFPDILPEGVLRHFGYGARPEGDLGKDALYQDRAEESVSNRSLLANAFEGVAQNDIERNKIQEYKSKIDLVNAEEQKLRELNEKIKELSFAKGPRDTAKIRSLQFEAKQTANRIGVYDKQLLRLEASKPLQDVLNREKKMAYQRAEQKGKEALAAYREKTAKAQRELLDRYRDSRKKAVEGRERTAMRHKVQSVVGELNQLLLSNDKKRHVPDSLKKAVADALSLVNMDTVGAEERAAKYAALIAKETDPDKIDAYTVTMENILRQGEKMGQRLKELRDAYEEIQNSDDPDIANAYDPVIAGSLAELSQTIGNTSLKNMTIEQLQDVYDMYRMVLTRVRDANKSLIDSIKETIAKRASRVVGEVRRVGGEHKVRASALDPVRAFSWNNLKPVYAMERIGSATMAEAYNNVRKGEDTWAQDVVDARAYYIDKSKKYGYDSWDFEKKYRFKSVSEQEFDLTLEQILSLYAYSKRDQAGDHLKLGGFVFDSNIETYKEKGSKLLKYKVNTADAHQISPEILAKITGTLTKEQTAFVDEMQDYLSAVMGAKGNEVTMKMYGVKLFKEKFYFPLKSAKQFMFEQNEVAGEVRIKNSGFTNKTKPKANNPVILNNFMDVWANHVNDMSMYHAFVLPLEDFNRIFNYNSPKQEGKPPVSVKGTIQSAYSPAAVSYVKQLITDLNGGAMADPRETFAKSMIARFKKAKVFSSLSVVIQQPSAIGRAFAEISPKYFHPTKDGMNHDQLWAELKQYAPVAIIKEMGYFDTNMGRSTQDFIKAKEYTTFKEKTKGLFTDGGYRDEVLSRAPALADELAWCSIWNAVKRETVAKHHDLSPRSEKFLEIAGERFTEVVTKTQVYDSVLARSANMRSKSGLMSMATSFMAEPTTAINMLGDAIRKAKRGDKGYAAKAFASVAVSVILNNALVALVYGMRDDDEDETYAEKYAQSFVSNMIDDLNPITYYPFLKDMWSLLQGYSVERSDMSLVSDLADATKALAQEYASDNGDVAGAWWDIAGAVANIGGIPMQNIRREINGVINFYNTLSQDVNGRATTLMSMGDALSNAVRGTLPVVGWLPGDTKTDKLYDAIIQGDTAYANRLKGGYETSDAYHNAVRKALRENDPRIKEAAQAQIDGDPSERVRIAKEIIADGFIQDDVVAAINTVFSDMTPKADSSGKKAKGFYTAEDFAKEWANGDRDSANEARADVISTSKKNGKTQEEAEESFVSSAKAALKELYLNGGISESRAVAALKEYCEVEEDDIYWTLDRWKYEDDTGSTDGYSKYNDFHSAVQTGKNLKTVIKEYTDNGVESKTLASQITSHFKPLYREMTRTERAALKGYLLNAYVLLGYDRSKKSKDIDKWLED